MRSCRVSTEVQSFVGMTDKEGETNRVSMHSDDGDR